MPPIGKKLGFPPHNSEGLMGPVGSAGMFQFYSDPRVILLGATHHSRQLCQTVVEIDHSGSAW